MERQPNGVGDVSWQAILGYLNYSEGRPDPRFQKQLSESWQALAGRDAEVVLALADVLRRQLRQLHASGPSAFRDIRQAEAILSLVFDQVLPAYRRHHADLLAHQGERDLFQPYFLARACEAVLVQGPPWDEQRRVTTAALARLNDYVGYRPVPVLETRPRGEIYDHERVAPIPLYLRAAGVAAGRYHDLVTQAVDILNRADANILAEAQFDPRLLAELSLDPRAYDHAHPANGRPNYFFGEWDPHQIDAQGRYRRFVVRQLTLDSLLVRIEQEKDRDRAELVWEAGAVLAGVVLMAAGTSGNGPTSYDSTMTLSKLRPRIAGYRDAFYQQLVQKVPGPHGDRLREEAAALRQPFGGVRRHLNQCLAQHRAAQLQHRHLALLFAEMGYPDVSREQAACIPTPAMRLQSEVLIRIALGHQHVDRGTLAEAAVVLPEAEDLIKRGIACGAFVDPWNILGFQGLFPLSSAREDSVRDYRIDELIYMVERLLDLYARLLGEAAATGDQPLGDQVRPALRRLADWWDRFASVSVNDVRRLHAAEAADAAEHVAAALARWRQQGEASAGPAFWKQQREFQSPKAFAQVVDALLKKGDQRAALALLLSWLAQSELVPLEDGHYSFHGLARRWLLSVVRAEVDFDLVRKFFDHLEANAEELWDVPGLLLPGKAAGDEGDDEEDDPYRAAYEDVTYEDSGDDGHEGALMDDDRPLAREFTLEEEAPRLEKRLRFLATVAQLWQIAARHCGWPRVPPTEAQAGAWAAWLDRAGTNRRRLVALLDAIHKCPVPEPLGSYDAMVEYQHRCAMKERLLETAIGTCLETTLAVLGLLAEQAEPAAPPAEAADEPTVTAPGMPWTVRLEQALLQVDAGRVRDLLPRFLEAVRTEPLLIVPLSAGGHPTAILQARVAQAILRMFLQNLPRLGLVRETYHLLGFIRSMEQAQPAQGGARRITEFDRLFRLGFQGVIECLVDSAAAWDEDAGADRPLVDLLKTVTRPFYKLWTEHSNGLQLSTLERVGSDEQVQVLREFIQRYGRDLFQARFMSLDNLRGVLHRGVGAYLDSLRSRDDPTTAVRLLDDLDGVISRDQAVRCLELLLNVLIENYEEFKDYSATTAQGAYGDNLHVLIDFLKVKTSYERYAWQHRPLALAHEVLARQGRAGAAPLWEAAFSQLTGPVADDYLQQLDRLETRHGVQLRTVRDRLQERFVKPLAIDRLCALVGPTMDEAPQGKASPALAHFLAELQPHTATPTGSGLDVPDWLARLEQEVRRLRADRTAGSATQRESSLAPRQRLTLEQVQQQIDDWDKPLDTA